MNCANKNSYRLVVRLNTSQENTMNRNSLRITALALLVLGTAMPTANAQSITNGGFETDL